VCVCVLCVCVRESVRACVRACVRVAACMRSRGFSKRGLAPVFRSLLEAMHYEML
jgi:hypothetical protein